MEKNLFEDSFKEALNHNFSKLSKYFDYQYKVFFELRTSVFEVAKCELLEFHKASITLTNNILERLLKLALIYNETGIGSKPVEQWNSIFDEPNKKFGSLNLGNSIELCKKHNLITKEEKDFLFNIIKELMRNGFSHADISKILVGLPEETIMFHGSLSNPTKMANVTLSSCYEIRFPIVGLIV